MERHEKGSQDDSSKAIWSMKTSFVLWQRGYHAYKPTCKSIVAIFTVVFAYESLQFFQIHESQNEDSS
jgi:hypothetical protein